MRAAKKDGNHNEVAAFMRSKGWAWEDTHRQSDGFPDGVTGLAGFCALVEVKPPGGKLTPKEQKFAERWTGPYVVAYSGEHCYEQLEAMRAKWTKTLKPL